MLQLFLTVAFSAAPLILYLPPLRSLNLFMETIEDALRLSRTYTSLISPRVRLIWSRLLGCFLCSTVFSL